MERHHPDNGWDVGGSQYWFYGSYGGALTYSYSWTVSSWFEHHIEVTSRRVFRRYWSQVGLGDIVFADWNGRDATGRLHIDHSMVVTRAAYPTDIYLTYHTTNRLNKSLKALQKDNPSAVWWAISAD